MNPTPGQRHANATILSAAVLALVVAGCGSSASSSPKPAASAASPATTATTALPARAPVAKLQIISPHRGARTPATITVSVRLSGTQAHGAAFGYVVDRSHVRRGSSHLTLRGLAPGRHRLIVTLVADPAVRASTSFTVRTPPPSTRVQTPQTSTQSATSQSSSAATPAPSPPVVTTTHTTTASPPPSSSPPGGIPQGGGGDGDADNSGGPSDGDGNI